MLNVDKSVISKPSVQPILNADATNTCLLIPLKNQIKLQFTYRVERSTEVNNWNETHCNENNFSMDVIRK